MNTSGMKGLSELIVSGDSLPSEAWQLRAFLSEECISYIVWNVITREAILIDPKRDETLDFDSVIKSLSDFRWLAVVDTHTHADHISAAQDFARSLGAPMVMQAASASQKPDIKIFRSCSFSTSAGPLKWILTPGHTPDGMCVQWGPFAFTGDTVLFGDVGRDDLPGGNAAAHFDSLEILKSEFTVDTLICPGHDNKGGRISSWATQLRVNSSLTQPRSEYVQESEAFDAPAPRLLKKSLFENLR